MVRDYCIACVQQTQCQVARWRGHTVIAHGCFDLSAEGERALQAWLQHSPQATLTLLFDCAEEHYQVEVLPAVRAGALRQLLSRRLAAWPPAAGLAAVHWIDSQHGSRREERYLLSALAADCPALSWVHALVQQHVRVRSIHLQSMLSPGWVQALMPDAVHVLCVICQGGRGRLCYLQQGALLFSRHMQLTTWCCASDPSLVNELTQTRLYLLSQRWLRESDVLQVLCISEAPSATGEVPTHHPGMHIHGYSAQQLLEALHMRPPAEEMPLLAYAAMVMLQRMSGLPNLASAALRHHDRVMHAKHVLYLVATALCVLAVVGGWGGVRAYQQLEQQVQTMRVSQQHLQAAIPVSPVSAMERQQVQMLMAVEQRLRVAQRQPDRLLALLPSMMDADTCWQIRRLRWWHGPLEDVWPISHATRAAGWQEVAHVEFQLRAGVSAMSAGQHWQRLLAVLAQQPEVAEVHQVPAASEVAGRASDGVLQGHTQQVQPVLADRPQLWLRFRPAMRRAVR